VKLPQPCDRRRELVWPSISVFCKMGSVVGWCATKIQAANPCLKGYVHNDVGLFMAFTLSMSWFFKRRSILNISLIMFWHTSWPISFHKDGGITLLDSTVTLTTAASTFWMNQESLSLKMKSSMYLSRLLFQI
jgi:hypothetical protein